MSQLYGSAMDRVLDPRREKPRQVNPGYRVVRVYGKAGATLEGLLNVNKLSFCLNFAFLGLPNPCKMAL